MNAHLSAASWRKRAACRGVDPEVFYPATDEDAGTAKSICSTCPVREACLEHACRLGSARDLGRGHRKGASPDPSPAQEVCVNTAFGQPRPKYCADRVTRAIELGADSLDRWTSSCPRSSRN